MRRDRRRRRHLAAKGILPKPVSRVRRRHRRRGLASIFGATPDPVVVDPVAVKEPIKTLTDPKISTDPIPLTPPKLAPEPLSPPKPKPKPKPAPTQIPINVNYGYPYGYGYGPGYGPYGYGPASYGPPNYPQEPRVIVVDKDSQKNKAGQMFKGIHLPTLMVGTTIAALLLAIMK